MLTHGKSRGRAPSLLLTLLLCCALAVGLGAAAPAFALTLGGSVANDVNGNGVLDAVDAPLAGILVSVQPLGGGLSASTTTRLDGTYSFLNLAANTYTVTVGSGAGLLNESASSLSVSLSADRSDVNFLFVVPGLIAGKVVNDLNGNGFAELGELGLPSVTLDLDRVDSLGQTTLITTATTSVDGSFFFSPQPAGTYLIVAHPAVGVTATGANAGSSGLATVADPNSIRVVLNGTQSATGLQFTERTSQSFGISGFVRDNTSSPVANVMVQLLDASQNLLASTLTDATGAYSFTSVANGGTYVVRVIPPPGLAVVQVLPSLPATAAGKNGVLITNLNTGINYANNNFVLGAGAVVSPVSPGSSNAISGAVINDLNGNGNFNGAEPGLAGSTLTLVASTGVQFGTTVTDSSGSFTFVNLPAGDYTLTRSNPAGYVSTGVQPGVGGTSLTLDTIRIIVNGSNNLYSGQLFLATSISGPPPSGLGTISGSVLQDTNGSNTINLGDVPIRNVQILLETLSGNILAQSFTDVNGAWAFSSVSPGTYQIVEVVPANFAAVAAFAGTGGFAVNPTTIQVTSNGGIQGNNNFLNRGSVISPTGGIISGSVLQDLNGNRFIDANDLPLGNVLVQLFVQGGVVAQAFTDQNGAYAFSNVPPGSYLVVVRVPSGLSAVASFAGLNGFVVNPTTLQVSAVTGVNVGNNNFLVGGSISTAITLSGSVLADTNGTGTINAGDTPLQGVVVQLRSASNGFLSQTTTDQNGAYAFSGLAPGTYLLVHLAPLNYANVAASAGVRGVVLNSSTIQVTIASGASGNNNFLDRSTVVSPTVGILSGSVIRDANGDGFIDAGDAPIPGVTVQLFVQGGGIVAQTTTDGNGAYAFTNVPPGSYQVLQIVPAGLVSLGANPLGAFVVAGINNGNNNFLDRGAAPPSGANTISGIAVEDRTLNGNPNGDPGLAGMQVVLRDAFSNPIATVVTDITGAFSFSGLSGGTYIVTARAPNGLTSTNAIPGVGGTRLGVNSISVTTSPGTTNYGGHLFLAGP